MPDEKISPDFKAVVPITIEIAENHLTGQRTLKLSVEENDEKGCKGIKLIKRAVPGTFWSSGENWILFSLKGP